MNISAPALYDKLTFNNQNQKKTPWREMLLRDIEFLLNDAARSASLNLYSYDHCEKSVINYGLPSLSKIIPINIDPVILAEHIQRILVIFEPRLDPRSIKVMPLVSPDQPFVLAILFDIYGSCLIPGNECVVNLRIALDYSCGAVRVF